MVVSRWIGGMGGKAARRARVQRILLFIVAAVILHGLAMFAAAQIVRADPRAYAAWAAAVRFLCGGDAKLDVDFTRSPRRRGRSLDGCATCRDGRGAVIPGAGQAAAWRAGLPISVPLVLVLAILLSA